MNFFVKVAHKAGSKAFLLFHTGLVPVATRDAIIPAPDLEGSLVPSREKASHVLATAGPVHAPANPNLVHAPANHHPVRATGNPSPVQRVVQR